MAIQPPVSTPSAPVAAAPAPLAPGDRIDARVVGPGADGLLRLATAAGPIDADLPVDIPAGSRASFIVQSVGARLTLSLIAAAAPAPAGAAGSAAEAAAPVPAITRSAVLQAVRQAALAGQDGPAPLLALLARLAPSTALPAPLRDAVAALSTFGLSAQQVADPEMLASAVARSGLFGEARAAAGRPVAADLKSALATVLATALAWRPGSTEAAIAPPVRLAADAPDQPQTADATAPGAAAAAGKTTAGVLPQSGAPAGSAAGQPAQADAPTRRATGPSGGPAVATPPGLDSPGTGAAAADRNGLTPSRIARGDSAPLGRAAIGPLPGSGPDTARPAPDALQVSQRPDGQAPVKLSSEAPHPGAALALFAQLLGRDPADASASSGSTAEPAPGRSPPPQADRAPAPSRPVPDKAADLPPDVPAGVLRATVIERTEAVLDRIVLSQLASLPAEVTGQPTAASQPGAPNSHQNGPAQSWVMDLPLRLPGETAATQLRVSRDGGRGAEGVDAPKGWTVDFALDTTATGPVHAR
ncbi:MAG: hypothetical protein ACOYOJ_20570, partial [Alsobacter sp.]